jgi:hypothetical protein
LFLQPARASNAPTALHAMLVRTFMVCLRPAA